MNRFGRMLLSIVVVTFPVSAALSITPSSATLSSNQSVTLTVTGADSNGVQWSLGQAPGTLVASGNTALYTGPSSLNASQSVEVQATSVSDAGSAVKAVLLLMPIVSISVSPASADLYSGWQTGFNATVLGSSNTAVQWTLNPANLGSINQNGFYSAPYQISTDATATVTAIAQADLSKAASVPIRLHRSGLYFTTNSNGLQSVFFGGTDYNYVYGEGLLTSVTMQPPTGPAITYAPTCSSTFTSTTVTKSCSAGSDAITLQVSYTTPSPLTVQADFVLTNNSTANTISSSMLSTLGVRMSQFDPANSVVNGLSETTSPVSYGSFGTGRFAIWTNTPGPNVAMNQACGWSYVCKNQPQILNVAPGTSASASFSLRFTTDMTQATVDLAPEAYVAYRAAYPSVMNWADRRPIISWFMADHGHQSATNPRGYLFDPTIDVSNLPNFQSSVLTQAQNIVGSLKARPVQPQGIILWDLEGEEFNQPTTYIGDPRVLSAGYAPEINSVADQVFALFRNAGLKVGITLRPNYMQWGPKASLPATCHYDAQNDFKDYFIAVDAAFQNAFFACYGANSWSLIPAGNGGQTIFQPSQIQQVIDLLTAKVAYARSRWGTTIYYVDSTVWHGGAPISAAIFRALQQSYPDSLFIPEESYIGTMGAAMPYSAANISSGPKFAPVTWRYAYPTGADAIYLSNCTGTCWSGNVAGFDIGQKVGDIALYSIPQQLSSAHLTEIENMILTARQEAGTVIVTDSSTGAVRSFNGTPTTVFTYPLKMRVYFATSDSALSASSVFCENGNWLGTNSCTLNLAGLSSSQVRYYDFLGNLISSEVAGSH